MMIPLNNFLFRGNYTYSLETIISDNTSVRDLSVSGGVFKK